MVLFSRAHSSTEGGLVKWIGLVLQSTHEGLRATLTVVVLLAKLFDKQSIGLFIQYLALEALGDA